MDPSLLQNLIGNLDLGFDFSRHAQSSQSPHSNNSSKQNNKVKKGVQMIVNINGAPFDQRAVPSDVDATSSTTTQKQGYSAVFLSNNQVYFGKLGRVTAASRFVTLRDVYYLREVSDEEIVSVDLIKLGSELHAPEDEMRINLDHILFYEPIQDNGPIVTAIQNFKD